MSCPKSGIKIHNTPNQNVNIPINTNTYVNKNCIDLNIENYSLEELYGLFKIQNYTLTDEVMREAKKIVLKMHPDKSKIGPEFFLFYSKAYKRLFEIYEFQNKSEIKKHDTNDYYDSQNVKTLDVLFETQSHLKDSNDFNKWFNKQFDKYKLEDERNDKGYGDWLKSDDGVSNLGNISKNEMNNEFEKQKKQIQSLSVYRGINDTYSSTFGGTILNQKDDNYTSSNMFNNDGIGYTDLKQAYVESVIPVTEDDYKNIPKFKNVDEYNRHRNNIDITPTQKEEALKQLYDKNRQTDEESTALAFHYAKQAEKSKENNQSFWASLKKITNL